MYFRKTCQVDMIRWLLRFYLGGCWWLLFGWHLAGRKGGALLGWGELVDFWIDLHWAGNCPLHTHPVSKHTQWNTKENNCLIILVLGKRIVTCSLIACLFLWMCMFWEHVILENRQEFFKTHVFLSKIHLICLPLSPGQVQCAFGLKFSLLNTRV